MYTQHDIQKETQYTHQYAKQLQRYNNTKMASFDYHRRRDATQIYYSPQLFGSFGRCELREREKTGCKGAFVNINPSTVAGRKEEYKVMRADHYFLWGCQERK
jgi:hypothetical protein